MKQDKLIQSQLTKEGIKSPVFSAQPGWSGQLRIWLKKNSSRNTRFITATVLIGATAYIVNRVFRQSPPPEHVPEQESVFSETAKPGQGVIHLARQALNRYLTEQAIIISPIQAVYAELVLSQKYASWELHAGQTLDFPQTDIEDAVQKSQNLSPYQQSELEQYVK